jgi:hypothetical protein
MKENLRILALCIAALFSAESFSADLSDEQPVAEHKNDNLILR